MVIIVFLFLIILLFFCLNKYIDCFFYMWIYGIECIGYFIIYIINVIGMWYNRYVIIICM